MPTPPQAHEPPAPAPASARYFALLYTPPARRAAMSRLLALADEIDAGAARRLDPSIAAARLEWWRLELRRYADGSPQHPWLRALLTDPGVAAQPDLHPLVDAAAQAGGAALRGALFVAAAELLGAAPSDQAQRSALTALGERSWHDERAARSGAGALASGDPSALAAAQTRIAPLLVWAGLSARPVRAPAPLQAFLDNLRAWRIARRATAGSYLQT